MRSAEKSAGTLKNFPSSSAEVTTKNNDSQISRRLSGVSASISSDQDRVPCPGGGGEKQEDETRRDPPKPGPPLAASEAARRVRGAPSRGRRAAAAAAIRRLEIRCPELRCPRLTSWHLEARGSGEVRK